MTKSKNPHSSPRAKAYSTSLRSLKDTHPAIAHYLTIAHKKREKRLHQYGSKIRFDGLEELLTHLEELNGVYRKSKKLCGIAFLIYRVHADFCTAIEASLSGYFGVASDAMRDVMEIEFLLRDFYFEPAHIQEWLGCDENERNNRFRPGILRNRHAAREGILPQDMSEAKDYRAHSIFLHVTPFRSPFGGPGLMPPLIPFGEDACFWDMFEHGRRVLFECHRLRRKLASYIKSPWGLERGLKKFRNGWRGTQEMQQVVFVLLDVIKEHDSDTNELI